MMRAVPKTFFSAGCHPAHGRVWRMPVIAHLQATRFWGKPAVSRMNMS